MKQMIKLLPLPQSILIAAVIIFIALYGTNKLDFCLSKICKKQQLDKAITCHRLATDTTYKSTPAKVFEDIYQKCISSMK
jgi:hypothetical protein